MKAINREIRSWHLQLKNDKSLVDLANMFKLEYPSAWTVGVELWIMFSLSGSGAM